MRRVGRGGGRWKRKVEIPKYNLLCFPSFTSVFKWEPKEKKKDLVMMMMMIMMISLVVFRKI
jgi:hypothetical protein